MTEARRQRSWRVAAGGAARATGRQMQLQLLKRASLLLLPWWCARLGCPQAAGSHPPSPQRVAASLLRRGAFISSQSPLPRSTRSLATSELTAMDFGPPPKAGPGASAHGEPRGAWNGRTERGAAGIAGAGDLGRGRLEVRPGVRSLLTASVRPPLTAPLAQAPPSTRCRPTAWRSSPTAWSRQTRCGTGTMCCSRPAT